MSEIYLVSIDIFFNASYEEAASWVALPICYFNEKNEAEKFVKYHKNKLDECKVLYRYFIDEGLLPEDSFEDFIYGEDDDIDGVEFEIQSIKKGKMV